MTKIIMSWADRFAMIDHYKPTDAQICVAFGLSQDELDTARTLRQAGSFRASPNLDVAKYANVFTGDTVQVATAVNTSTSFGKTKPGSATTHTMPETASKRIRPPQKRGRKGDKISRALMAVPTTQTPVETFMAEHDVSLAVLRQSKRFIEKLDADVQATIGQINVRQDKATKTLMIWREPAQGQ